MQNRLIKLLLTIAVVIGGVGFIVYSSMGSTQHYKMVSEFMAEPTKYVGKTMRLHGYVESGSIDERIIGQSTKRTFVLEHDGARILVHHDGPVPDTFKDKSEVVARGKVVAVDGQYELDSDEIMAKCPSKYEGLPRDQLLGKGGEKRSF